MSALEDALRELIADPYYVQAVIKETPATRETVVTDPTPIVLVADIERLLDGAQ